MNMIRMRQNCKVAYFSGITDYCLFKMSIKCGVMMVFYATEVFHLATYFVSAVNVQRSSSRTSFTIPSYLEKTNQKFAIPEIW